MVKIKTLIICCGLFLLIGIGGTIGIGAGIIGGTISRALEDQQLAEDRAKSLEQRLDKLTSGIEDAANKGAEINIGLGDVDTGITNGIGRVKRSIDYNQRIENILRNSAVLE